MDPQKTAFYVKALEDIDADLANMSSTHMLKCKAKRDERKPIFKDAKADGFTTKALKAIVAQRAIDRKRKQLASALDLDEQSQLEQMHDALGQLAGTPLGEASLRTAA